MSRYDMRLVEDNAKISKRRSYIPWLKHKAQVDFNAGLLVPVDRPWEILPGDTFKVKHSLRLRMSNPPKVPPFDLLCADLFYFYVPLRIVWNDFDKFITGDTGNNWSALSSLTTPKLSLASDGVPQGCLLDFLGYNVHRAKAEFISALPVRGYYEIWNYYFRYEPLQNELLIPKNSNTQYATGTSSISTAMATYYTNISSYYTSFASSINNLLLAPVNKLEDYFTRCLPQPQAGPNVSILGLTIENPVSLNTVKATWTSNPAGMGIGVMRFNADGDSSGSENLEAIDSDDKMITPFGLSGTLNGVGLTDNSINSLRKAFAIQSVLDIDARYGRRINSWSIGQFGVTVPDFRVSEPEFLSRTRFYLNVNEVIQSSATEANSPQGNVGAWSETRHVGFDFIKSFVEHGYIYCLMTVRILNRTYSQGTDKIWKRNSRFDFYLPALANISDQPVNIYELYNEDNNTYLDVFGYQECWADMKFMKNHIANHMKPTASDTLAVWNFAEYYGSSPSLSASWILEGCSLIDRTMYLTASNTVSQFILDIYFDIDAYRTMPVHSLPGGLTHSW